MAHGVCSALSPGLDASTQCLTSRLDASTSKLDASTLPEGDTMICHIKDQASTHSTHSTLTRRYSMRLRGLDANSTQSAAVELSSDC